MTHTARQSLMLFGALCFLCFALSTGALANDEDYTRVGHNINVKAGEQVSEATCFGCSIHVHGQVSGDVTAIGGSIVIEDQGRVGGDVTALGGDIRLAKESTSGGDVTAVGGQVRRAPEATVGGDITSMAGRGWVVAIFLAPLVFLGAFIALVVWVVMRVVQRARRPALPIAA